MYDCQTSEEICSFQAHDQEVGCLDYSPFLDSDGNYVLASGSRDRLIHVYCGGEEYKAVNTLEGHSSSIVAVKFAFDPDETDEVKRLKLLSCGFDKTIIYRSIQDPQNIDIYHKEVLKNNKISAMDVQGDKVVAGLDKLVTVTNIRTHVKSYEKKPEKIKQTGPQDFHKVMLDKSETFLISASTDKYITIQDTLSGVLVSKATVGELITSLKLSLDNKHLITTSSEGSIYFWRLNEQVTRAMNQRMKEFGMQVSTNAFPIEPILEIPEFTHKKPYQHQPFSVKKEISTDSEVSPGKVLFSGKSPAEILFLKNQQKMQAKRLEEVDPSFVDMTKSMVKREETKQVVNVVDDVVGGIDMMFSTANQQKMKDVKKGRSPRGQPISYQKAKETEEMYVETGQLPDWAITKAGDIGVPAELAEKDNNQMTDYEMENSESSITLQPQPAQNNFMVEDTDIKDRIMPSEKQKEVEDDQAYEQDIDENQFKKLEKSLRENEVRKSYVNEEVNSEDKNNTGKFGNEEVEDFEEEPSHPPEKQFASFQDRRNQGKIMKKENNEPIEDDEDQPSNEIESILMKNKSDEKKGGRRKKEWKRNSRKPQDKHSDRNVDEELPIDFLDDQSSSVPSQPPKPYQKQDSKNNFGNLDLMTQTPKPNTNYPVPSRENEYGESSFAAQTRQYQNMRGINVSKSPSPQSTSGKAIPKLSPRNNYSTVKNETTSESKPDLKTKIPTIGAGSIGKKHFGSFIEEKSNELQAPTTHILEDDFSMGDALTPQAQPNKYKDAQKRDTLSMNNNDDNLSAKAQVKSETNSGGDVMSNNEGSVHIDEKQNFDAKSETYNFPYVESVTETHLMNVNQESVVPQQEDPVASAAVNATLSTEVGKINESLRKLITLTGRSDSRGVQIMPEVQDEVNKSFNLWLSMMVNLKANSQNDFQANIKF